jgi:hypothetical protein
MAEVNLEELYMDNSDFKTYVDRYSAHYSEGRSISIMEALTHRIVRQYAEQCIKKEPEREVIVCDNDGQ